MENRDLENRDMVAILENRDLSRNIANMRRSLFDEGIVNQRFHQLEQEYPPSLEKYMNRYLRDSATMLPTVEQEMNTAPIDFPKVDGILDTLWRESYVIGLNKVRNEIEKTRDHLWRRNLERAKVAFQDMRIEHDICKTRIEFYFLLQRMQNQRLQRELTTTPRQ